MNVKDSSQWQACVDFAATLNGSVKAKESDVTLKPISEAIEKPKRKRKKKEPTIAEQLDIDEDLPPLD